MKWNDHLENLKTASVVSANKAIDYLDGDQLKHLEAMLTATVGGVTKWRERGVLPVVDNVTMKIVSRSALNYQQEPERMIYIGDTENEAATVAYADLLGVSGDVAINASDIISRLLKTCMVLVQYVAETDQLSYSVLHRGNCDVDYDLTTQEVKSILYTAGGVGPNGGKMYHHWTPDAVTDIEQSGQSMKVLGSEENPYGIIPVAVRYDIAPPRSGFWPKNQWEELIRLNEVVNRFHTEIAHATHFQVFPALFTNADIAAGTVIGSDAIVKLEGDVNDIYLEYKTPVVNLEPFKDWLTDLQTTVADNWGVNLKLGGGGSADSGFKLIVEETWNLELRKQRQKAAKVAEENIYKVILTISDIHNLGLPSDSTLYVDFAEPALAVDTISERQEDRADVAAGLMSKEQVWKKVDPDLSPEDIEERKSLIDGQQLPDFTDAISEG